MYTDVIWKTDGRNHRQFLNSFVFKMDNDGVTIYRPNMDDQYGEVQHRDDCVFAMHGGPIAIYRGNIAYAYLSHSFDAPEGSRRKTLLCGKEYPEVKEVEIYHLISY